jgi:hypothetical protein
MQSVGQHLVAPISCRYVKKTRGFMQAGSVDPEPLMFVRTSRAGVRGRVNDGHSERDAQQALCSDHPRAASHSVSRCPGTTACLWICWSVAPGSDGQPRAVPGLHTPSEDGNGRKVVLS